MLRFICLTVIALSCLSSAWAIDDYENEPQPQPRQATYLKKHRHSDKNPLGMRVSLKKQISSSGLNYRIEALINNRVEALKEKITERNLLSTQGCVDIYNLLKNLTPAHQDLIHQRLASSHQKSLDEIIVMVPALNDAEEFAKLGQTLFGKWFKRIALTKTPMSFTQLAPLASSLKELTELRVILKASTTEQDQLASHKVMTALAFSPTLKTVTFSSVAGSIADKDFQVFLHQIRKNFQSKLEKVRVPSFSIPQANALMYLAILADLEDIRDETRQPELKITVVK